LYSQFNIAKSGAQPSEAVTIAKQIVEDCDKLSLSGLMTIGSPENSSNEMLNPDFALLGKLKFDIERELNLSDLELSMGMSDDYEKAIKQGSTNVRVGSTIFGSRIYTK
jgi:PLP dependent protein